MTAAARFLLPPFALLALVLALGPAGWADESDDFDFGRKLAENGYFDFARKVYEQVIASPERTDEAKSEARYGLALLRQQEALAATGRPDVPYAEVAALFDGASRDVEEFARQFPNNRRAQEARLSVGTIRLAFVQWARELLQDAEEMQQRGTSSSQVTEDAKSSVDLAIEYFDGLRPPPDEFDPAPLEQLAAYYYVICQYYRALVFPVCSQAAVTALTQAGELLDEYVTYHDGELLAVYAQDIYGLVWWELAKCQSDPEKKEEAYSKAFEWFQTCLDTENLGPDFLRVITSGYYHMAQAALDAGRMSRRDFEREAIDALSEMLRNHPTAWRTENGLRALVEWSKLECQRGDSARAIDVAKDAADRAKTAGFTGLERIANRQLNIYVSGGCGGTVTGQDPEVLRRVADDLFLRGAYEEAIRGYRNVIAAAPDTRQGFLNFEWHAWQRMAVAYRNLGDRLGEALAYEPVHVAWVNGVIPRGPNPEEDPNLRLAGDQRRFSQMAIKGLYETTGAGAFETLHKKMRDGFPSDYPNHPSAGVDLWNTALDKWRSAGEQRERRGPNWQRTYGEARELFLVVAKDEGNQMQEAAWVYVVRTHLEMEDHEGALTAADEALAWWERPSQVALAEQFPNVRPRREKARSEVVCWKGHALFLLERHADVIALLSSYHQDYPDARSFFSSMAYAHLVESHVAQGDIEAADRFYRTLLRSAPDYFDLPNVTAKLAEYYNVQQREINARLRTVLLKIKELLPELRAAQKESYRLEGLLADTNNRLSKNRERVATYDRLKAAGEDTTSVFSGGDTERNRFEREDVVDLEREAKDLRALHDEKSQERDGYQKQMDELRDQEEALKQELYEPLVKAAGYYKLWDDALKREGIPRSPDTLVVFGQMYWYAGTLRPEVRENWENARSFYEDYLAHPTVADRHSEPEVRRHVGRLGEAYINLAETASDPAERQQLVVRAVERLQHTIADIPENNALVVAMLENAVLVLQYRHPNGTRYRFAVPLPADAEALGRAVQELTYEDLPRLRGRPGERDPMQDYRTALNLFKQEMQGLSESRLQSFLAAKDQSTFDPILYRMLADSSPEFRLSLAWAYAHSGRAEDIAKAVNLALSLVKPPINVAEDTPEWWRGYAILLHAYMAAAELDLAAGGEPSGLATTYLERAGKILLSLSANYPDLGESAQRGNRAKFEALLSRLNGLAPSANLGQVELPRRPGG